MKRRSHRGVGSNQYQDKAQTMSLDEVAATVDDAQAGGYADIDPMADTAAEGAGEEPWGDVGVHRVMAPVALHAAWERPVRDSSGGILTTHHVRGSREARIDFNDGASYQLYTDTHEGQTTSTVLRERPGEDAPIWVDGMTAMPCDHEEGFARMQGLIRNDRSLPGS